MAGKRPEIRKLNNDSQTQNLEHDNPTHNNPDRNNTYQRTAHENQGKKIDPPKRDTKETNWKESFTSFLGRCGLTQAQEIALKEISENHDTQEDHTTNQNKPLKLELADKAVMGWDNAMMKLINTYDSDHNNLERAQKQLLQNERVRIQKIGDELHRKLVYRDISDNEDLNTVIDNLNTASDEILLLNKEKEHMIDINRSPYIASIKPDHVSRMSLEDPQVIINRFTRLHDSFIQTEPEPFKPRITTTKILLNGFINTLCKNETKKAFSQLSVLQKAIDNLHKEGIEFPKKYLEGVKLDYDANKAKNFMDREIETIRKVNNLKSNTIKFEDLFLIEIRDEDAIKDHVTKLNLESSNRDNEILSNGMSISQASKAFKDNFDTFAKLTKNPYPALNSLNAMQDLSKLLNEESNISSYNELLENLKFKYRGITT